MCTVFEAFGLWDVNHEIALTVKECVLGIEMYYRQVQESGKGE